MLTRFATALLAALSLTLFDTPTVLAHGQGEALLAQIEPGADASAETASGVVHVLTIDNPLRGTSSRHVDLQLDDGTLLPLRGDGTVGLHTGARVTVSGRHDGRWLDVASAREVAGASSAGGTKSDTQIDGSFAILHADDFAGGKSSFIYQLRQASGKGSRLRLGASPPGLAPGMHVRVAGHAEADGVSITPDHITVLAEPTASTETGTVSKAATADSVLVIMANFSNTVAPAFTSAQAQQVMTSNPDSVANFFREASYGQQVMNVTITPSWVTMNLPQPASCGDSDWQMIGASAEAAAKAQGATYDPASYDFVVYVFPAVPACGWLGLAYIGSPHKAWINGTSSFRTAAITHEMGHNFGLLPRGQPPLRQQCHWRQLHGFRIRRPLRHDGQPARHALQRDAEVEARLDCVDIGGDTRRRIGHLHVESAGGRRRRHLRDQDSYGLFETHVLDRVPSADRLRQSAVRISQ
jgi:Gametolysin peptidase M11.